MPAAGILGVPGMHPTVVLTPPPCCLAWRYRLMKAQYIEYTDDTFTTKKPVRWGWRHMGPCMRPRFSSTSAPIPMCGRACPVLCVTPRRPAPPRAFFLPAALPTPTWACWAPSSAPRWGIRSRWCSRTACASPPPCTRTAWRTLRTQRDRPTLMAPWVGGMRRTRGMPCLGARPSVWG